MDLPAEHPAPPLYRRLPVGRFADWQSAGRAITTTLPSPTSPRTAPGSPERARPRAQPHPPRLQRQKISGPRCFQ